MGRYFNKGRGNLPLTLSQGKAISVPGNSWVTLEGRDETTASVRRAVQKGMLHRAPEAKEEVKTPAPEAAPAPEVKAGDEVKADTASASTEASTSGSVEETQVSKKKSRR
jgi:hypothetical protein